MEVSKKKETPQREKHQRFSIRKFNVGVASVAIAAFWMVNGAQVVRADELGKNGGADIVQIAPAEEAVVEEDEEPAQAEPVAETAAETPVVEELAEETTAAETAEVDPAEAEETVEEVQEETKDVPAEEADKKEETVAETKAEEKKEDSSAISTEKATETKAETVAAPVTRVAATTYRVQYVDEETQAVVYQRNYSVSEETTDAADQPHDFSVNVALEFDSAKALTGYVQAESQEVVIRNSSIEAIVTERGSNRTLKVAVRKDTVAANNNSDKTEGYTALKAEHVPIADAVGTEYENYNAAEWTMGEVMDTSSFPPGYYYKPTATKQATGTITSTSGKEVTVDVEIESTHYTREDGAYLWRNNGMTMTESMGVVADDVYAGHAAPADIPALGVIVYSPSVLATGLDYHDHLNYDGEVEVAQLTLRFSEEVTNPIIDFSGIGGFAATTQVFWRQPDENTTSLDDVKESYWRGSYTSTKFELMTDGITLERVTEGRNITVYNGSLEVADKNTNNRGREAVVQGIQSAPSGTGTMQLTGTFSEVKFKLIYQVTPMSYYVEDGDGKKLKDAGGVRDGINGWNYIGDGTDGIVIGNNSEVVDVTVGGRTGNNIGVGADEDTWRIGNRVPNADAFVMSVRLVQTGDVLIDYVDTEGKSIKEQFIDTPVSPVDSKTPPYNTQENDDEYPAVIEVEGVPYTRVTEGDYTVGRVEADGHLSSTTQDWGTDEVTGEVEEKTKKITYVYQPTGSVRVNYIGVDADGATIVDELQADSTVEKTVADGVEVLENAAGEKFVAGGTAYDTTEEDTKLIEIKRKVTSEAGKEVTETWRLVSVAGTNPHAETDGDAETGTVEAQKTKEINYYYEKVTGDVTVNYYAVDAAGNVVKDANGNPIAISPTVELVTDANIDENYDSTDEAVRVDVIEYDGSTYKRVDINGTNPHEYTDGDAETGQVAETDQNVNYYYEKVVGDVLVHYVNEDGETIAVDQVDTPAGTSLGTAEKPTNYDTTDLKPITLPILDEDGKPTTKTVPVVDENGDPVLNADGTPKTAEVDTYYLVPSKTTGVRPDGSAADENGNLVEGTTEITYVYALPTVVETKTTTEGDVIVHYVNEAGETIKDDVEDEPKTTVTTTTVTTVKAPDGTVVSTTEETVNSDAKYDTAVDNKPQTIVHEGKTYTLTAVKAGDVEAGAIVEGTTEVTYIYKLVTGDVIVNYYGLDHEGNELKDANGNKVAIAPTNTVVEDGDVDTAYDTTPETIKVPEIVYNGVTYRLVADEELHVTTDGDAEKGKVEGDKQKVINYYYLPVVGDVIVHYVNEAGETIAGDQVDTPEGTPTGTSYNTTDMGMKPETIKSKEPIPVPVVDENGDPVLNEDGTPKTVNVDTYYLTAVKEGDKENGSVVEGTTEVTYIYALPKVVETKTTTEGDVIVHYVDTKGNTIATDNVDEPKTVISTTTVTTVLHPDGKTVLSTTTAIGYSLAQYDTRDENAQGVNTKPATIDFDGKTYKFVEVKTGDRETGLIVEGTTEVTYIYDVVVGEVVARYVIEGTETEIADQSTVKPSDTPVGEAYTDKAPERITKDGVTYELVAVRTKEGDAPTSGEVVEGKQTITYEYREVPEEVKTGEVVARYVIEGTETEIADQTTVKPSDTPVGETYTDAAPTTITKDGKTYELVAVRTKEGDAPTDGEVVEGKQTITYEYKEVKGNVIVHYIDTEGNTIKEDVVDTPETSTGTPYDTTDNKPEIIEFEGKTYKRTKIVIGSEDGKVVPGTTEVTYVYSLENPPTPQGNVVVHYINEAGEPIKDTVIDTPDTPVDEPYDTTDNKPSRITKDGKTYELVPTKTVGNENGKVIEGTTEVTYVYREVKGDVIVHYIDTEGNTIKETVVDTPETSTGTPYDTTDNKPEIIEFEGKTYKRTKIVIGSEDGKVVPGTTEVTYVYSLENPPTPQGNVVVHYVNEAGEPIKDTVIDTPDTPVDEPYDTTDNKPSRITKDGKTYELVPTKTVGNETGKIVEGTTEVTYVYREVKGDVIVHYIDTEGNTIKETVVDTPETSTGTPYDTTDNKPEIIEFEGKTYKLTPIVIGEETGEVVPGTTEITYVYSLENPPTPQGNVVVHYVNEAGETIKDTVIDTPDTPVDEPYDTTDNKPSRITKDGKTYELVPTKTVGNENGKIVEGTTEVTYVYREVVGEVVARYVIEGTEVEIADPTIVKASDTPIGEEYTDKAPERITKDGVTYELVAVRTNEGDAPTSGEVVEGKQTITYEYKEVKGNVIVHYIDTEGNTIKETIVDTPEISTGTPYDTTDNKPEIIEFEGKTYKRTKIVIGSEDGKVVPGTTEVTYVYSLENPPTPQGNVVVHYVNEAGEPIKDTVIDTPDTPVNEPYDTTDNKPSRITKDGKTYELVPTKTVGNETGKIVEGTTEVTYVYREVVGEVVARYVIEGTEVEIADSITVKASDTPVGEEYTDKAPERITKDGVTYELVRTRANEGDAPTDGEVVEGKQTITYEYKEVKGNVIVHYIDTEGNAIKETVVDTPETSTGTPYDTTDNKPETIEFEGKTYKLTPIVIGEETGEVVPGTTEVTYVYTLVNPETPQGNVIVHYVNEAGETIKDTVIDTPDTPVDEPYDTTDNKPSRIIKDGKTYELVPTKTVGNENGKVIEGTTEVTYVYREVKGDVIVHYIDTEGNTIKETVVDTPETSTGTPYDTTDNKPETITVVDEEGNTRTYRRVPTLIIGDETGSVVEGRTEITYVYEEVIPETPVGSVVVRYHIVDENGNVIVVDAQTKVNDTVDAEAGTDYDTTDYRPATIVVDGVTYDLVAELTTDAETGSVEAGVTKEVNYHYVKRAETPVTTVWVLSDGTVIRPLEDGTLPKDAFEGYVFVETIVDENGNTTHVFKPLTTVWVTEDDKVLRPLEDGTLPKDAFEGYVFVETVVDENGNTTHIFKPLTTVWVTEDGTVLRPLEDGTLPKDAFDGYNFVETTVDEEGNTVHIFKPVEVKPVTTIWVTVDGTVLRPLEDGTLPKDAFEGYEFVRTVVDADGNTIHIFKPVKPTETKPSQPAKSTPAPKYVTKETKALPNTGEAESSAVLTGLGMMFAAAGLVARRRRKED